MTEEKRRAERVRTSLQVLHSTVPIRGMVSLVDLSPLGARFEIESEPPELDAKICLSVSLDNERPSLLFAGKVVRHTDLGFAIAFETANQEIAEALEGLPCETLFTSQAPIREIYVHCMTSNGEWFSGYLCALLNQSLVTLLNRDEPFMPMRDVASAAGYSNFVSLRYDAVDLIVPNWGRGDESVEGFDEPGSKARPVRCHIEMGLIEGNLRLPATARVSDHVSRTPRFMSLSDCRMTMRWRHEPPADFSSLSRLLLNTRRVNAISDLGNASPPLPSKPTDT